LTDRWTGVLHFILFFLTFEGWRGMWVYSFFFSEDRHGFYFYFFFFFRSTVCRGAGNVGFFFFFLIHFFFRGWARRTGWGNRWGAWNFYSQKSSSLFRTGVGKRQARADCVRPSRAPTSHKETKLISTLQTIQSWMLPKNLLMGQWIWLFPKKRPKSLFLMPCNVCPSLILKNDGSCGIVIIEGYHLLELTLRRPDVRVTTKTRTAAPHDDWPLVRRRTHL
jgi:hypothetical protein